MSVAFWSAAVKVGKKTSTQPPEGYVLNLQNLALADADKGSSASIWATTENIEGDNKRVLLATLRGHVTEQFQTSLVFGYDVPVEFQVVGKGSGTVHFSGYIQPGPMDEDEDDDEYGFGGYGSDDDIMEEDEAAMYSAARGGDSDEDDSETGDSDDTDPRVQELDSDEDMVETSSKSKGKGMKRSLSGEVGGSDSDFTSSDEEDNAMDEHFISKMIKKPHEPEPTQSAKKNKGVSGGGGDTGSGKKKKTKGKGRGK